jgi:hypothetical protein
MEMFFDWAESSSFAGMMPLREIHMRAGSLLLQQRGVDAYGVFLERTRDRMLRGSDEYGPVIKMFSDVVHDIEELKRSKAVVL